MREALQEACLKVGIVPRDVPADDRWHPVPVEGKGARNTGGRIKLFSDGEGGQVWNWTAGNGAETFFFNNSSGMTAAEIEQRKQLTAKKVEQADRERELVAAKAASECQEIWNKAQPAPGDHPYLQRKQIKPHMTRVADDGQLLVPVRSGGEIVSLQYIPPDEGIKMFHGGSRTKGGWCFIGKPTDTLVIAEGFATGACIHEVTGHGVLLAFSSVNLLSIAGQAKATWPNAEIIIAADDDAFNPDGTCRPPEGNTGIKSATAAAVAIGAKLAIPLFPEPRTKEQGSDFQDLFSISGAAAVIQCINASKPVQAEAITGIFDGQTIAEQWQDGQNSLTSAVERLAALSPLQYDQVRIEEAKILGVRPATLDAAIRSHRKQQEQQNDTPFHEVEPADEPVDGQQLLDDLLHTVKRFIVCDHHVAVAASLWIAAAWFADVVRVAPFALITAPEKRCGKSTLLELIGRLTPKSLTASSITPSALFRSIDLWGPTLLIDEVDATLKDNEELRGLLNSGHTRSSAYTIRCTGDDHTPTKFSTWGFKALSGIGHVSDTLMDRSIILELRRKLPNEQVQRMHHAPTGYFDELCSRLARFSIDNTETVRTAKPPLPESLHDRARDMQVVMGLIERQLPKFAATLQGTGKAPAQSPVEQQQNYTQTDNQQNSSVDMSQLSDSDLEAIARNDMTKVSDAGLAHIVHSGGNLHSNIAKYEQQGYSAKEILEGIKVSGKYGDISTKINKYAADGYTPEEILAGLKQSKGK